MMASQLLRRCRADESRKTHASFRAGNDAHRDLVRAPGNTSPHYLVGGFDSRPGGGMDFARQPSCRESQPQAWGAILLMFVPKTAVSWLSALLKDNFGRPVG